MGLFSFVFSLAFIVAPAGGMAIYDRFGADAVWYVCAALCVLIAAAFSALRPYLEKPKGVEPTLRYRTRV
jgi:predicted MFS family arabinose efflux permease